MKRLLEKASSPDYPPFFDGQEHPDKTQFVTLTETIKTVLPKYSSYADAFLLAACFAKDDIVIDGVVKVFTPDQQFFLGAVRSMKPDLSLVTVTQEPLIPPQAPAPRTSFIKGDPEEFKAFIKEFQTESTIISKSYKFNPALGRNVSLYGHSENESVLDYGDGNVKLTKTCFCQKALDLLEKTVSKSKEVSLYDSNGDDKCKHRKILWDYVKTKVNVEPEKVAKQFLLLEKAMVFAKFLHPIDKDGIEATLESLYQEKAGKPYNFCANGARGKAAILIAKLLGVALNDLSPSN